MFSILQRLRAEFRGLTRLLRDNQAPAKLSPLGIGYVPWSAFALDPETIVKIVNDVLVNERSEIVEFGSEISTIYIAKTLKFHGTSGTITSFDNDPEWQTVVGDIVEREGLVDYVDLVTAPLAPCSHSVNGLAWYDEDIVARTLHDRSVDLLIVDGPKAYETGKELARFPAFPAVAPFSESKCAIFLDHTRRRGEQKVLQQWKRGLKFDFDVTLNDRSASCIRGNHF